MFQNTLQVTIAQAIVKRRKVINQSPHNMRNITFLDNISEDKRQAKRNFTVKLMKNHENYSFVLSFVVHSSHVLI